jgi:hypothetical protein
MELPVVMQHFERILNRLDAVSGRGRKRRARCKGHDDTNASLEVTLEDDGFINLRCRAGCTPARIWRALGISPAELQPDPDEELIPAGSVNDAVIGDEDNLGAAPPPADPGLRDCVYRAVLAELSLRVHHRDNLRGRGLDDLEIDRCEYRSISFFSRIGVVRKLREQFTDDALLGVPGFLLEEGAIVITGPNEGLVVPVRRLDGKIAALKIRKDVEGDGPKFVYLSGNGGPSCGAPAHVPSGVEAPAEVVRITEGE